MAEISPRKLVWIRALAAMAAAVSTYLLLTSLSGGHLAGCGPASGCHDVLASSWAYWLGIPVSAVALLVYSTVFLATFWATPRSSRAAREKAWFVLSLAGLLVLAAALWFIALQTLVLGHVCPYCLVAHAAGTTLSVVVLRHGFRPSPALIGAAALGAAILVSGHWINRRASHELAAGSGAEVVTSDADKARQLAIFGGMFKININEVPLIGHQDAPAVIVALLDYTCRHCRQMHGLLLEAVNAHGSQLAVASLPMPLDASCNKLITRTAPPHMAACQYARLALAVWRADPRKMDRFNEWMFEPPVPPGMESALGYAQEIVGDEALGRAMNDPWVEKQLAQNLAIYEATYRRFGKGVMPQLIVGDNIVFGELENGMQDLDLLLRDILK